MAKFCAYCGKQLEDGEVCGCRQQAAPEQAAPQFQQAPQGMPYQQNVQYQQPVAAKPAFDFNAFLNDLFKTVLGIFKAPKKTAKEFVAGKNFIAAFVMIGLNTILSALFALILFARLNSKLDDILGFFGGSIKFPVFKIFAITFLFSIILSAAFFGLNALIGVIFKEQYDVKAALCVTGIRCLVCVPVTVLAIILGFVNPGLGIVLFYFGALVAAFFVQQTLAVTLEKTADYQVYINIVLCLIMLIVFYILAKAGMGVYMPEGFSLSSLMSMF